MKTQVELLKENCDIKDAACVRYQKRIAELEEENKKLKAEKDKLYIDYENLSNCNADLIQENKKLKEYNGELIENHKKDITILCEENKKLKEKLQWWKDLVHKAKEFEYDEDGMDYIWQQTKI